MKEKYDLMVGDWVMWKKCPLISPYTFEPLRIMYIESSYDGTYFSKDKSINSELIFPIPLCSNILEKIGFDRYLGESDHFTMSIGEKDTPSEFDTLDITLSRNGLWMLDIQRYLRVNGRFFIRYVHELQHILRLAEIDIPIEL